MIESALDESVYMMETECCRNGCVCMYPGSVALSLRLNGEKRTESEPIFVVLVCVCVCESVSVSMAYVFIQRNVGKIHRLQESSVFSFSAVAVAVAPSV